MGRLDNPNAQAALESAKLRFAGVPYTDEDLYAEVAKICFDRGWWQEAQAAAAISLAVWQQG